MTCAMNPPPPEAMNYIFVDYENVQKIDLDLVRQLPAKIQILVGRAQPSLPKELVCHHCQAKVTWLASHGATPDALDMVLAFQMGQQVAEDPRGHYWIISKDKGYNALIENLNSRDIVAFRSEDLSLEPAHTANSTGSPTELIEFAINCLRKSKSNRPTKRTNLANFLKTSFPKTLSEPEMEPVIGALFDRGHVTASDKGTLSYHFPE